MQEILIPVYDLTVKKREFSWGEEHQNCLRKTKHSL